MSTPVPNQATIDFANAQQALLSAPEQLDQNGIQDPLAEKNAQELHNLNGSNVDLEKPGMERSYTLAKREGQVLPPLGTQLKNIVFGSWLNLLLICVPIGIIAEVLKWGDVPVFLINFFAVIPLAKLLGFATEELALRTSQTIGGLLNATFGNAVELIIGIVSLKDGLINVVQASILGSILGNLLLILGLCFFLGGLKFKEQKFNPTAAGMAASLMNIAVCSLVLLSAFFYQLQILSDSDVTVKVLELSRGVSILLLVTYGGYLFFQLKTHKELYVEESDLAEHAEEPAISLPLACILLVVATTFVAVAAEFLVGAIEGVSHQLGLSTTFVGFILLPVVGNAAEHLTVCTLINAG
jgi:Ca2+:H+ antiporter